MSKEDHKERQRVTKACDNCRKKKIKCDAKADICTSCELLQIPCQYLDPTKKRGPPKGAGRYINGIEDRLHRMESIVGGLVEDEPNEGSGNEAGARATGTGSSSATSAKPRRRKSTKSNAKPTPAQQADQEMPQNDDSPPQQQQLHPQQQFQQIQPDHQHHSPSLQDYSMDAQQQHQQQYQQNQHQQHHPFRLDSSFQQQQQQHFMQQQQLSLQQQHLLDSRHDPSQSPDRVSQTHSDVVNPSMISPLHQDLLRETGFPSFNSPSPILGSENSHGDFSERSPGVDTLPRLGMHTPPMTELDDLEEDMGHLTLDHKGHERYVGKSSPMFYNRRHWGGFSIRERDQPEARKFVENPDLPSPELMTRLLNLYFTYVHPFAPVFVWSKFLRRLQTRDYSPSFLFLLNSIFALASRFSDDISLRTDPTKPETVGVHFVEKAKAILDTIYDAPDMYCVGALVLLSYQQMGTGGGYRAWMFIGLSIRMAQHLGLNRDCMKLNPHMPALDREERNRIWWTCFVADRLVSASFGRPQGINEHDVDATYPEGMDEENIQLEYKLDNASSMLTGPSPHSEKNFVYMASLTRIMGRVMVSLYSPLSRASSLSNASMTNPAPLEQLDKELTDWLLTLPPHLQFRSVQQEPGTFVCTLHMTFYATLILLHRPYSHQSPQNSNDWSISLSICTSAANNTIEMASNLMRTSDDHRDVPRLKCLLHSAVFIFFTAGLVHITNCTSLDPVLAASAKLRTVETLRCLSVIEDVWLSGKWCGNNIKNLLKSRNIELPCSVEGFKYTLRNGADAASTLNGVNPAQLDLLPTAFAIPKEQSFAFDVDQIMGYYQPPGIRHAQEPMGRNSRHFSPTPYFSPVAPHLAHATQNHQARPHPGLIQGHSQLPRRPRQTTKNTSPSPGSGPNSANSVGGGGAGAPSSQSSPTAGGHIYSAGVKSEPLVAGDSGFYATGASLIDPFVNSNGLGQQQQQQRQQTAAEAAQAAQAAAAAAAAAGSLSMYQNPFSNTLWTLPASMDNDEWMLYMQNGGANGNGASSQPPTPGNNDPQQQQQQQQHQRSNSIGGNTNSSGKAGGVGKALSDRGSPTLLDNNSVNLANNNHNSSSSNSNSSNNNSSNSNSNSSTTGSNSSHLNNRMHPLAQSMTRNELLNGSGGSNDGSGGTGSQQQQPQNHRLQQQQPLLASQSSSNEYAYFMNSGSAGGGSQSLQQQQQQQAAVSSQSWGP